MPDLVIRNLEVRREDTTILRGVDLAVPEGQVVALMGPNGSGKSTLAQVIMGHPEYEVVKGDIRYGETDVLTLAPEERARLGIFLAFQHPQEVAGVTIGNFLRLAYNSTHSPALPVLDFVALLKTRCEQLGLSAAFIERSVNEGFSGGEKKRAEMLQLAVLEPRLALLDEIDSGLDVDALKIVARTLKRIQEHAPSMSLLLITHYPRLLTLIKPQRVVIMDGGRIVREGDMQLLDQIEERGYGGV
jgi:Fe-S cluster assembly ATP-binding protein